MYIYLKKYINKRLSLRVTCYGSFVGVISEVTFNIYIVVHHVHVGCRYRWYIHTCTGTHVHIYTHVCICLLHTHVICMIHIIFNNN